MYLEGDSITSIGQKLHHKNETIKKILIKNNLPIEKRFKGPKKIFTEIEKEKIIKMAKGNYTYEQMAKEMNCSYETVKKFLNEQGIEKPRYRVVDYELFEDFFEKIDTEEKAYWLGLLKTDGYIKKRQNSSRVGICLKREDEYMVENFKKMLNSHCSILKDNRSGKECSYIEITSTKICNDLSKYDIVPNKTYLLSDIKIDNVPKELQRHYLRGLLDGDGSIWIEKNMNQTGVSFCGYSKDFVQSFQLAIDKLIGKEKHNQISKGNSYHCKWKGNQISKKILTILYEDASIYLIRKKNFYDQLKNK